MDVLAEKIFDTRLACSKDVNFMYVLRSETRHRKAWAEKDVVEELKRGPWLEPAESVVLKEDVGHVVTKAPRRICYVIGCQ